MNKYTKELLEDIVKESSNVSQVCRKVGVKPVGDGWKYVKNKIKEFNIDSSHFTKRATYTVKRDDYIKITKQTKEDVLVLKSNNIKTSSYIIRRAMIESDIDYVCNHCGIDKWFDRLITLQIHHIDGNSCNNLIDNLIFLCPNCHSLTENFGAKNIKRK